MKKLIGYMILAGLAALMFWMIAKAIGVAIAAAIFIVAIASAGLVWLAVELIHS